MGWKDSLETSRSTSVTTQVGKPRLEQRKQLSTSAPERAPPTPRAGATTEPRTLLFSVDKLLRPSSRGPCRGNPSFLAGLGQGSPGLELLAP